MKKPHAVLILLISVSLAALAPAAAGDQVDQVLERFFQASGGLDQLSSLQSLSVTAGIAAYDYQYTMQLLADGRCRIEAPDRITIYDGQDYWQAFHGVSQALTGEQLERYQDISLSEIFFHGFLEAYGGASDLEYAGSEVVRGQTYELLTETTSAGNRRTYYLNAETSLLDKMVELIPDPDLRELKNVHRYSGYQDVDGITLPSRFQIQCMTNGEQVQPLTQFTDFKLNEGIAEELFVKPASTAHPVNLAGEVLLGHVVGISGGGSLITSITLSDLEKLGVSDGATLIANVKAHEIRFAYLAEIEGFAEIGRGDYLATFNNTPALWLVKAYLGMTSDDSTYAQGDEVRLAVSTEAERKAGE